jgi:hypothetical protein
MGIAMARRKATVRAKERNKLLGVRVTAALKTKVKVEAARREISVARLFEEMWQGYLERERVDER